MLKRYPNVCVFGETNFHTGIHYIKKETDTKPFDLLCSLHFHSSVFFFNVWSLWMHANVIRIGGNFNAFILFLFLSRLALQFFFFCRRTKNRFSTRKPSLFICLFCISLVRMLRKISYILNCGSFCVSVYKIQFNLHANSRIFLC